MKEKIKIQLIKSLIGVPEKHKRIVKSLGLRKRNSTVIQADSPEIRGSVFKVSHLLKVERVKK
ncbi:MAG TPA: 50S ribosomal protein L30 [Spirochaetes bacterium]|nr:50S ribosomal protein L30 [Spirochaetota bacterium]